MLRAKAAARFPEKDFIQFINSALFRPNPRPDPPEDNAPCATGGKALLPRLQDDQTETQVLFSKSLARFREKCCHF